MVFSLASGSFLLITHPCSHNLEQNWLRDWLLIKRNLRGSILPPGQTSEYKQTLSYPPFRSPALEGTPRELAMPPAFANRVSS